MPRTWLQNPFKTHDVSDFPGVYVPMANVPRHQSAASGKVKEDESDSASTSTAEPVLTIETLRAEVEADLAAGGHDTAYDRRFTARLASAIYSSLNRVGLLTVSQAKAKSSTRLFKTSAWVDTSGSCFFFAVSVG